VGLHKTRKRNYLTPKIINSFSQNARFVHFWIFTYCYSCSLLTGISFRQTNMSWGITDRCLDRKNTFDQTCKFFFFFTDFFLQALTTGLLPPSLPPPKKYSALMLLKKKFFLISYLIFWFRLPILINILLYSEKIQKESAKNWQSKMKNYKKILVNSDKKNFVLFLNIEKYW